MLRRIRPTAPADVERKRQCIEHLAELRRLDAQLVEVRKRTVEAVSASDTTVTEVHGVGPLMAAIIVGHTGGVARFPSSGHLPASTAPLPSTPLVAKSNAIASTPGATASSTTPFTWRR